MVQGALPINWAREYTTFLEAVGFVPGAASPCNFYMEARELRLTAHGDDFTITGPQDSLTWLRKAMEERFEIESEMLAPEAGMVREIRVLNRIIRWTARGIEYEPDQRHSDLLMRELGTKNAKPVNTPCTAEGMLNDEEGERYKELQGQDATKYRALAARLNY